MKCSWRGQLDYYSPLADAMQDSCATASVPHWGEQNRDWPLVAQLEPLLGEDFAPDEQFFVESWTNGVAAAAENLRLRRQALKDRAQQKSSWQDFYSFIPRFSAEEFLIAHQRARDPKTPSSPGAGTHGSTLQEAEELHQDCERDYQASDLLAVERARCLLGVDTSSSRRQIRTAYRRLVRLNHPDCLVGASAQAKQIATERTTLINKAYHLLCGSRLAEPA
jgi:DnaJ-domain-containing protein 1